MYSRKQLATFTWRALSSLRTRCVIAVRESVANLTCFRSQTKGDLVCQLAVASICRT